MLDLLVVDNDPYEMAEEAWERLLIYGIDIVETGVEGTTRVYCMNDQAPDI